VDPIVGGGHEHRRAVPRGAVRSIRPRRVRAGTGHHPAGLRARLGHSAPCARVECVEVGVAQPVIERIREAAMNVITLPTSNLFTEGRADPTNSRRGLTRLKDLWRAGVNVSLGTDNLDDTYLPFSKRTSMPAPLILEPLTSDEPSFAWRLTTPPRSWASST